MMRGGMRVIEDERERESEREREREREGGNGNKRGNEWMRRCKKQEIKKE